VFIPKYRRKILYGRVRVDLREIIRKLCDYKKIRIIEGSLQKDHVHLCVAIPPKISVSDFVGYLKGKSALMMFDKHPELGGKFDRSLWARGYYVSTIGNVNEEIIREYIRKQEEDSKNEQ
jgi:putative transposase